MSSGPVPPLNRRWLLGDDAAAGEIAIEWPTLVGMSLEAKSSRSLASVSLP